MRLFSAAALAALTAVALVATTLAVAQGRQPARVTSTQRHLDAHDGGIVQGEDGTFWLFGTSYDCGFRWHDPDTRWCGVNVYRSADIRRWTRVGLAFEPTGRWQRWCMPGGCFRPHVVQNPRTGEWVMWLNVFTGTYRVLTADNPAGPWRLHRTAGKVRQASGDANLFVDRDGQGWLVRTDLEGYRATASSHELVVERLGGRLLRVRGRSIRTGAAFVEAGTMWQRGDRYYLAFSDPACPYCPATGTSVQTAKHPTGPWSKPYRISDDSCDGQPTHVSALRVDDREVHLYQSDQWVRPDPAVIEGNQAAARQAWVSLSYDGGRVQRLRCPD